MGNSSSRDKDLIIYIQTQKTFYNSGSIIEGTVFVYAKRNFSFDALYIRVEGDEWCQWFEGSSKNRQKYTGSQNFYAVEHILEKYPQKNVVGSFAYPFSIELSENIPGSFESPDNESRIEYKLAAYFVDYSENNNKEIQYIPLHVRESFRQQFLSLQGHAATTPKSCGCFEQGAVELQVKFDRNVCYEGESVLLEITINNINGTTDVNYFRIQLKQYNFVSANSGVHRSYDNLIDSVSVEEKVPKGEIKQFKKELIIKQVDQQTAIGTLVANYYRIEVYTNSGSFSSQNPCVYAPLFILKKQFGLKRVSWPNKLNPDYRDYSTKKMQVFKAPEHWFKKNMNLQVMNFRLEDQIGQDMRV